MRPMNLALHRTTDDLAALLDDGVRYDRIVRLVGGTGVEIINRYSGTRPPVLSLMLCERPDQSRLRYSRSTLDEGKS